MKRWEYCTITLSGKGARVYTESEEIEFQFNAEWEQSTQEFLKVLNGYGRLGWEVVIANNMLAHLLLKRDIDNHKSLEYLHASIEEDNILVVTYANKKKTYKIKNDIKRSQRICNALNKIGFEGWEVIQHDFGTGKYLLKKAVT